MANSDKNQLILKPGEPFKLKREIRATGDGSPTIYLPELNENYHSTHGAVQESMHVFIEAGLHQVESEQINVFEVGFGTGLNCLLTFLHATDKEITYHSIEKFPVEDSLLSELKYGNICPAEYFRIFKTMHELPWDNECILSPRFKLKKIENDLSSFLPDTFYKLIYFDAFAPEVQPELWTPKIFQKMFEMMESGGILVTYCAKGEVRRTMQACGFKVERIPGPPGKREMLRARKP